MIGRQTSNAWGMSSCIKNTDGLNDLSICIDHTRAKNHNAHFKLLRQLAPLLFNL